MTASEAIKILKKDSCYECAQGTDSPFNCEYGGCRVAKATRVAIKALEKQIPKRPIFSHNLSDTLSVFHCECGNVIKVSHDTGIMDNNNAPNYCSNCGCKFDWSDEE
jgi:hypothetical protein|nr:MAG TPA: zinc-ribbon domain protein [Caudoviricetes sp.]DAM82856.1 MAG TPA: zinc-ribbon domain protein [Caudoviricetes sp.]